MSGSDRHLLPVRLLLMLGALSAMGPLSIDMYLPSLPVVGSDLHASTSAVQLTLTACMIGLGAGQLVVGPLSDTFGRRKPMVIGMALFAVFSLACALTSSLPALIGFRFLQALGGSAGLVVSRAIARDLRSGVALARLFSILMLVNGTAPILAPILGAQLVRFTSWRGVFVILAVIGVLLVGGILLAVPDTLSPELRRPGNLAATFSTYRALLSDRAFVLLVLTGAFAFATMFAYISGSPFVLEERFGLSAQLFSAVFAINALGIVLSSQLVRVEPTRAVRLGLGISMGGAALVALGLAGHLGLPLLLPGFFLITAGFGATAPNVTALALSGHPEAAGAASAVFGAGQFLIGGSLAPLVGLGGRSTLPMVLTIVALATAALCFGLLSIRLARRATAITTAATPA
ncbi:MAG: transporter, family, multidrug resistance protein [Pseudonocardiales bacterium]|jgi:DHA1 family bicyclomycin/chloramphenicol resistance-like MFS transporter|nr:transporter, family, multidrug resistance protein [Pseudonocardiales bacterium]MDQ1736205.1 transporter, family, multidrug resistance protein [Pseudonocardiales bacterium]